MSSPPYFPILFRESESFPIATIDSVCLARNEILVSVVFCEVGDNLKVLTAERKVVRFKRRFDPIRTRIRQEAVYQVQYGPASPEYFIYTTNKHVYLDDDKLLPLHYLATDIKTSKTYLMFKGQPPPKKEPQSWL